ncbi:hypothetical protein [Flavobacterium sp. TSSA_36]|uniref:hypothetical protein n=1 Tax=Flavobacterium sp. TSSA_36 TaxID=3447669 RepID=UPI003F324344
MMKRIASIFLIATLFYNVLGYYLLFHQQEEQQWVARMEHKEPSTYKILQMNASIYTFVEDTDFEYVNENITLKNKHYHIFKKRIQNNILYLYYLPNSHQDTLNTDLNSIVEQQLFDHSTSKDTPTKKLLKIVTAEYVASLPITITPPVVIVTTPLQLAQVQPAKTLYGYYNLPYSPPDVV